MEEWKANYPPQFSYTQTSPYYYVPHNPPTMYSQRFSIPQPTISTTPKIVSPNQAKPGIFQFPPGLPHSPTLPKESIQIPQSATNYPVNLNRIHLPTIPMEERVFQSPQSTQPQLPKYNIYQIYPSYNIQNTENMPILARNPSNQKIEILQPPKIKQIDPAITIEEVAPRHIQSQRDAWGSIALDPTAPQFGSNQNPSYDYCKNQLNKTFFNKPYNTNVVATINGNVIGFCYIKKATGIKKKGRKHVGVFVIGIMNEYRGKGIGQYLGKKAIELAFQKGMTRIELFVYALNSAAVSLQKKLGFQIEVLKKKERWLNGEAWDTYVMGITKK